MRCKGGPLTFLRRSYGGMDHAERPDKTSCVDYYGKRLGAGGVISNGVTFTVTP